MEEVANIGERQLAVFGTATLKLLDSIYYLTAIAEATVNLSERLVAQHIAGADERTVCFCGETNPALIQLQLLRDFDCAFRKVLHRAARFERLHALASDHISLQPGGLVPFLGIQAGTSFDCVASLARRIEESAFAAVNSHTLPEDWDSELPEGAQHGFTVSNLPFVAHAVAVECEGIEQADEAMEVVTAEVDLCLAELHGHVEYGGCQIVADAPPQMGPPDGFVSLKSVLGDVQGKYTAARKLIGTNRVSTWKPSDKSRRLYVNAAEWIMAVNQVAPSDEDVEKFLEGVESRKSSIPKKPGRKPRELPKK
jgi:hypothetical protein